LTKASEHLRERGDKLDQLSEKTSKLAANANHFAELAKQLNKEKSSFWW
jgi:ABC-type transporter Mla subunit MlaD